MSQILIVEDDPILGESIKVDLEVEGYNVVWARSLNSALEMNQNEKLKQLIN